MMVIKWSNQVKYIPILWPNISTLCYLPKRSENMCPRDLFINVQVSFICFPNRKSPKHSSTCEYVNKLWNNQIIQSSPANNIEQTTGTHIINKSKYYTKGNKSDTKMQVQYYFNYLKF